MSLNADDHAPDPGLTALSDRLGAWRPATTPVDRDRLLFAAGASRAEARLRRSLAAAAGVTAALVVALGLVGSLWQSERSERLGLLAQVERLTRDPYSARQAPRLVRSDPEAGPSYLARRDTWIRQESDPRIGSSPAAGTDRPSAPLDHEDRDILRPRSLSRVIDL
jgi:hypothetical protein